ncbi:hypothetical protein EV356DRAFT_581591 [Viridothelium virens]|uniref:MADS-box domain-containing protein n=1 Tax=Viridothelium virens TaxID=1048519 RepID=A0A6A6GSZ1_VIRVR|nr:hypothetical protein EV356DRAFT_581591 [Viridothelium virens]
MEYQLDLKKLLKELREKTQGRSAITDLERLTKQRSKAIHASCRRRRNTLFRKANELAHLSDAHIYVLVQWEGKYFTYSSTNQNAWPPTVEQVEKSYPQPTKYTATDFLERKDTPLTSAEDEVKHLLEIMGEKHSEQLHKTEKQATKKRVSNRGSSPKKRHWHEQMKLGPTDSARYASEGPLSASDMETDNASTLELD